jgi:hypothetical protein
MFSLMDVLASREDAISLKDIAENRPAPVHRPPHPQRSGHRPLRRTLAAGSYRLGMRLLELGNLVKGRLNVRDAALLPMRELHKKIQQPVNLSVRQGDEIIYVERAYSERSGMQVVRAIGGRAPLHLTSVGKLFLAADDVQRIRAYATRTGLHGQTKNSITQLPALERETGQGAPDALRAGQRRAGAGCALHGVPASTMTRASWWRACRSLHRPAGSMTPGWASSRQLPADLRHAGLRARRRARLRCASGGARLNRAAWRRVSTRPSGARARRRPGGSACRSSPGTP